MCPLVKYKKLIQTTQLQLKDYTQATTQENGKAAMKQRGEDAAFVMCETKTTQVITKTERYYETVSRKFKRV